MNDPTAGSNGSCTARIAYICNAGDGYDGPTGVGTISGAVATGAPGIGGPGPDGSYAQSTGPDTAQLEGGVYPNGADTKYWWEYGTTTSYGQQTEATDIGSGVAPVSVADQLAGLSPGATYHYRLVAQNSYGTEYGYDFTLTTQGGATGSSQPGPGGSTTQTTPTTTTAQPSPPATGPTAPAGGTSSSAPASPLVARLRVASAGATTATLTAAVATGGSDASYSLQYGPTSALGRSLKGSLASASTRLTGTLRALAPGRVYYVRAVITNPAGSTATAVIRFRTSPVTITRLAVRGGRLQAVLRCYRRGALPSDAAGPLGLPAPRRPAGHDPRQPHHDRVAAAGAGPAPGPPAHRAESLERLSGGGHGDDLTPLATGSSESAGSRPTTAARLLAASTTSSRSASRALTSASSGAERSNWA